MEAARSNSVTQNSDTMSNGSATPPTGSDQHPPPPPISHDNGTEATNFPKFVFPQGIPISPGIFGGPTFFSGCATSGCTPITPTLLTPAVGLTEPYFRAPGQMYSPLTLAPPTGIPGSLPKTPTLPPPSPHAIVGGFPLTSQGLPTSATLPFSKGSGFMDDMAKLGSIPISPFIMSPGPGLSPTRKANGTIFFPTTITANGDARLTTLVNGITFTSNQPDSTSGMDDGSRPSSTHSPMVKMETSEPPACCVGDKDNQA